MSLVIFGEKVKAYLKAAGYTQKALALALNWNPSVLTHKLNGTGRTIFTHPEIKAVIRELASLKAISRQAEVVDLLKSANCPNFDSEEWQSSPLNELYLDLPALSTRQGSGDVPSTPHLPGSFNYYLHNLPVQLTSFIGRGNEITETRKLLGRTRLLTLTGTGGIGKSRLALQAAADLAASFKDGVWLVELVSIKEPAQVAQSVAQVLAVREERGKELIASLIDFLKPRELLLVLDNCEHQVEACAELSAGLLHACPGLRMLVTSREILGIIGESVLHVPPLSSWEINEGTQNRQPFPLEPAELSRYEAVQLFVARTRAIQAGFMLNRENAWPVAQVCHRLDGLPLALELAAARMNLFSVEQLVEQMDKALGARFELLKSGSRTLVPRHQTLRGLIDWSYTLLSPKEQALLRHLSVFAGSFDLEAVVAITLEGEPQDTSGINLEAREKEKPGKEMSLASHHNGTSVEFEVLELLGQLVNKSMVLVEHKAEEARYRLLETIRQYAWEKLEEQGEAEIFRRKHCLYYLQLVEQTEVFLASPHQNSLLKKLNQEYENIRATFSWVTARARSELENRSFQQELSGAGAEWLEYGMRLAGAMSYFMFLTGYTSEGWEWLEQGLNWRGAGSEPYRARALRGATLIANFRGDFEEAERLGQEAVALFRQLGNREGLAEALNNLSQTNCVLGRFETAIALAEESVAQYRQYSPGEDNRYRSLEDDLMLRAGLATSLYYLGYIRLLADQIEEAHSILTEVLSIFKQIEAEPGLGQVISLNALALIHIQKANYTQVHNLLESSLQLARKGNHVRGIPPALFASGWLGFEEARYQQAEAALVESIHLLLEMGERAFLISNLELLAGVMSAQEQAEKGAALLGLAQAIREIIHAPVSPLFQHFYGHSMELTRTRLDEAGFNRAWKKGASLYDRRTGEINLTLLQVYFKNELKSLN